MYCIAVQGPGTTPYRGTSITAVLSLRSQTRYQEVVVSLRIDHENSFLKKQMINGLMFIRVATTIWDVCCCTPRR